MIMALLMVLLVVTLVLLAYLGWRRHNYWNDHGVRYVLEIPVVGNFSLVALQIRSMFDYVEYLYWHRKTRGADFFGVNIFFRKALVIRNPALIRKMIAQDSTFFCNRQMCTDRGADPFGYYNLLMIKEPLWKDLRSHLSPSVTSFKLKRMLPLIDQVDLDLHLIQSNLRTSTSLPLP